MRKSKAVEALPESNETLNEQIARKAYELYEQRGGDHGHDLDDWLVAERLVQETTGADAPPLQTKSKVVSIKEEKNTLVAGQCIVVRKDTASGAEDLSEARYTIGSFSTVHSMKSLVLPSFWPS